MTVPMKLLYKCLPLTDSILLLLLYVSAPIFKLYAMLGGKALPRSRQLLKKSGVYPIHDQYYQPLFRDSRLKRSLREPRNLPGIDWRPDKQLELLEALRAYSLELLDLELSTPKESNLYFNLKNGTFESGDAEFYYLMIRKYKPRKIVEIGCGNSSQIARLAAHRNRLEDRVVTSHICIEPYENPWLESIGIEVKRELVEDCDHAIFEELSADDILFIDSSHIIRPQGDVVAIYLDILPRLKSGVVVHVHDIFSPRDYLDSWIKEDVRFWNEQYLVEVLLSNISRYKILAALNYLHHSQFSALKKTCPYLDLSREPGSLYFQIL